MIPEIVINTRTVYCVGIKTSASRGADIFFSEASADRHYQLMVSYFSVLHEDVRGVVRFNAEVPDNLSAADATRYVEDNLDSYTLNYTTN